MDKAEYKIKLEEINRLVEQQDYESALEIVDTIDWRRVKSVKTLVTVADIYEANRQYANAKTVLKLALDKATIGKSILYRLSEISIKTKDFDDAVGYYTEFMSVAPKDNSKYILKYKIYRGRKSSIEEQIAILEEYKEHEYTERWSYELARLYQRAGMIDKCVEECDDLILWFSDGNYVLKAMEMKKKYAPLTPAQLETLKEIENRKQKKQEKSEELSELKEEDIDKIVANAASMEMNLKKLDDAGAALAKEAKLDEEKGGGRKPEISIPQFSENLQAKLVQSIRSVFSGKEEDGLQSDQYVRESIPDLLEEPYIEDMADYEEVQELEPENLVSKKMKTKTPQISMEEVNKVENTSQAAKEATEKESVEELSAEEVEELLKETAGNLAGEVASGGYKATALTEEERLLETQRLAKAEREAKAEAELKKQEATKQAALAALEKERLAKDLGLTREFNFDKEVKDLQAKEKEDEAKRLQEAKEASKGLLSAVSAAEAAMEETDKQKEAVVSSLKNDSFILPEEVQKEIEEKRLEKEEREKELQKEEELDEFAFVEKLEAKKAQEKKEEVFEEEEKLLEKEEFEIKIDESIVDKVLKEEEEKEQPSLVDENSELSESEEKMDAEEVSKEDSEEEEESELPNSTEEDKETVVTEPEEKEAAKDSVETQNTEVKTNTEETLDEEELNQEEVQEEMLEEEEIQEEPTDILSLSEKTKEESLEEESKEEDILSKGEGIKDKNLFTGIFAKVKGWFYEKEEAEEESKEELSELEDGVSLEEIEDLAKPQEKEMDKAEEELEEKSIEEESQPFIEEKGGEAVSEKDELDELAEKLGLEAMKLEIQEMASEKVLETEVEGEEDVTELLEEPQEYLEDLPPVEPRKLSQEEKRIFTYFARIPGLDMQITEALEYIHRGAYLKTSKQGNIVIVGRHGSGKTKMARDLVKAACLTLRLPAAKVAFLDASDLNEKDPATIVGKLLGGFLVIERASYMHAQTVEKLTQAMSFRTDSLKVILEDEKYNIRNLMQGNPAFADFFDYTITIPVFTNDELVSFAKTYVKEEGYRMEERGVLALYRLIGENQNENEPMTVGDVKAFVDRAIGRANRGGRKPGRRISKRHLDGENRIYLYEKDFDK
ncbi:MAG TPA: hypothetical protein VIR32_05540 [Lachnospiraceae bacterium]